MKAGNIHITLSQLSVGDSIFLTSMLGSLSS